MERDLSVRHKVSVKNILFSSLSGISGMLMFDL